MDPLDKLIEGAANLVRGEGAVTIAADVLLDEILRETRDCYLLGVEAECGAGDGGIVGSVER